MIYAQSKKYPIKEKYLVNAVDRTNRLNTWVNENFPKFVEIMRDARLIQKGERFDKKTRDRLQELYESTQFDVYVRASEYNIYLDAQVSFAVNEHVHRYHKLYPWLCNLTEQKFADSTEFPTYDVDEIKQHFKDYELAYIAAECAQDKLNNVEHFVGPFFEK